MRKKVEYYSGYEITNVVEKINLIALRKYRDSGYSLLYDEVDTLEELSYWNNAKPEEINIILEKIGMFYIRKINTISKSMNG